MVKKKIEEAENAPADAVEAQGSEAPEAVEAAPPPAEEPMAKAGSKTAAPKATKAETGSTVVFVTHSISEAVFLSTRVVVMSARPGRITSVVPIELAQPRTFETREDPRFFELVTEVRELLHATGADDVQETLAHDGGIE